MPEKVERLLDTLLAFKKQKGIVRAEIDDTEITIGYSVVFEDMSFKQLYCPLPNYIQDYPDPVYTKDFYRKLFCRFLTDARFYQLSTLHGVRHACLNTPGSEIDVSVFETRIFFWYALKEKVGACCDIPTKRPAEDFFDILDTVISAKHDIRNYRFSEHPEKVNEIVIRSFGIATLDFSDCTTLKNAIVKAACNGE